MSASSSITTAQRGTGPLRHLDRQLVTGHRPRQGDLEGFRISRSGRRCRPRWTRSSGLVKILLVGLNSTRWPGWPAALRLKNAGVVGDAGGLLHVVGDDDDRVLGLQLVDQVLDRRGRDRVERRARLVHQQHLRLDGDRAGDAEPLLLATGEAHAGLVEPVLDLVPEVRAAQRLLDDRRRPRTSSSAWRSARCRRGRCRRSTSSGTGSAAGRPCRSGGVRRPGRSSAS